MLLVIIFSIFIVGKNIPQRTTKTSKCGLQTHAKTTQILQLYTEKFSRLQNQNKRSKPPPPPLKSRTHHRATGTENPNLKTVVNLQEWKREDRKDQTGISPADHACFTCTCVERSTPVQYLTARTARVQALLVIHKITGARQRNEEPDTRNEAHADFSQKTTEVPRGKKVGVGHGVKGWVGEGWSVEDMAFPCMHQLVIGAGGAAATERNQFSIDRGGNSWWPKPASWEPGDDQAPSPQRRLWVETNGYVWWSFVTFFRRGNWDARIMTHDSPKIQTKLIWSRIIEFDIVSLEPKELV